MSRPNSANSVAITLSYIIATRNRLPFLKITLQKLIASLQNDEEIVVVDGDSTDGAKEYLQQLFETGKIHRFVSEPDRNQAHGWNKAMLMAKGILIKKVIDDDVLCYTAIEECKNYMLQNPSADVLISNDLSSSLYQYLKVDKHTRLSQFEKWNNKTIPSFPFSDVHMIIRRSSLSFIGLYHTAYVMMDWEYSLRISFLRANIVYYTGYNALSVDHPQTATALKDVKLITMQGNKGKIFYDYPGDGADISYWSKIKIFLGHIIYKTRSNPSLEKNMTEQHLNVAYDFYYRSILEIHEAEKRFFVPSN